MGEPCVLHDVSAGGVHTLRLNRPERLNALNPELIGEAVAILSAISRDPSARAVVVTGAGRGFCSGADVGTMDATFAEEAESPWGSDAIRAKLRNGYQPLTQALLRVPVPTIAAVRGPAVGGGLDLTCACDLVIASETASFMVAYTHRALFPDLGGYWLLPRIIGYRKAVELTFTGRSVAADEALGLGLVTRVVADDALDHEAAALAEDLAQRAPIALRLAKLLMQRTASMEFETALEMGAMGTTITETSLDFREAVSAFIDKRQPDYRGR